MPSCGIASPLKIGCLQFLHQRSLKLSVNEDLFGNAFFKKNDMNMNINAHVRTGALYWCPVLPGCSVLTHGGWMAPQQPAVMGAQHSTAPPHHRATANSKFSVSVRWGTCPGQHQVPTPLHTHGYIQHSHLLMCKGQPLLPSQT